MKDIIFLIEKILHNRPELMDYKLIFSNQRKRYYFGDYFPLCVGEDFILKLSERSNRFTRVGSFFEFFSQLKRTKDPDQINVFLSIEEKEDHNDEITLFNHQINEQEKELVIVIEVTKETSSDQLKSTKKKKSKHNKKNKQIDSSNDFFGFYD